MKLILLLIFFGLFSLFILKGILTTFEPDKQCLFSHFTSSKPPANLSTAKDYFEMGNYNYDRGDCLGAITSYTKTIELSPKYAEAYNNRAYTYMRMQNYVAALPDLNEAIKIRPNYVNALMNQGDLYNYYGPVKNRSKAIDDYNLVLKQGKDAYKGTSLCGHRAMAITNGMIPLILSNVVTKGTDGGCSM